MSKHNVPRILSTISEYKESKLFNKQIRGGVLPYTIVENKLYFCFGVDKSSGDYTDFAGSVELGEDVIDGALREFEEESRNVFGCINKEKIQNLLCIFDEKNLLILMPFTSNKNIFLTTRNNFLNKSLMDDNQNVAAYNENKDIIWLDENMIKTFFIDKQKENNYGNMFYITFNTISYCFNLTYSMEILKKFLFF